MFIYINFSFDFLGFDLNSGSSFTRISFQDFQERQSVTTEFHSLSKRAEKNPRNAPCLVPSLLPPALNACHAG
jgi:hypothetical protein